MPKYSVYVPFDGYLEYRVDADNPEQAKEIITDGDISYYDIVEWVEEPNTNLWSVEEE